MRVTIKVVAFDLDGTLLDTYELGYEIHCSVARVLELERPTKQLWNKHWGKPWPVFIKGLWPNVDLDEVAVTFRTKGFDEIRFSLIKKSLSTLYFLKNTGKKIALVTNRGKESGEKILDHLGIKQNLFDFVQFKEDHDVIKPYPAVFDPLVKHFSQQEINKDEIVYVGDTLLDWHATRNAGMRFFAVLTGGMVPADFIGAGLKGFYVLNSVVDLPLFLNLLNAEKFKVV